METAQTTRLPIPENPSYYTENLGFNIRESGEQILPYNERAVYRCISISHMDPADWKATVWITFGTSDPGYGLGIALTKDCPKHEFFIDDRWKNWAKGPIYARSNGADVLLSTLEISFI